MATRLAVNCDLAKDYYGYNNESDNVVHRYEKRIVRYDRRQIRQNYCDPRQSGRTEYSSFSDHACVSEGVFNSYRNDSI